VDADENRVFADGVGQIDALLQGKEDVGATVMTTL
jgi:hypothetical protein